QFSPFPHGQHVVRTERNFLTGFAADLVVIIGFPALLDARTHLRRKIHVLGWTATHGAHNVLLPASSQQSRLPRLLYLCRWCSDPLHRRPRDDRCAASIDQKSNTHLAQLLDLERFPRFTTPAG